MTFIIAEVGSNWSSFEDAKDSIAMAKNCGADAVKYQLFTEQDLYGRVPWSSNIEHLPKDWIPKLKEKSAACGIEFMCTAFSPDGLRFIDKYVSRHKIASSDLSYPELLDAAKATKKAIYLSVGGSSIGDIDLACRHLAETDTTLLYCISAYPSKCVNLFHLDRLKDLFKKPVGYSCHTTDWYTPVAAVKYHDATVIEKHFKIREMDTPDAPHSLLPEDFKLMVEAIRGKAKINFPDPQEKDMLLRHNRRLIATADIPKDAPLIYNGNFGVYRSLEDDLEGLSGFAYKLVNGKLATKDIKAGKPIGPKSFR